MDDLRFYNTALSDAEMQPSTPRAHTPSRHPPERGGTINPSGAVQVAQGGNQTFTITPNSGYIISSVTVDGVNKGGSRTYTFTNVQANHTITAAFTANTDLVAYYKFDETSGTTAYDSTANAKNGTLYGNCTWATGLTNNAP